MSLSTVKNNCDDSLTNGEEHDPHFEPIITLPEVKIETMEEEEIVLIQLRAKLFRHDTIEKEWKERGTGDVKLLHNSNLKTVRIVMRRDKTYKLCANHYVTHDMKLNPSYGSDRAWVWTTMADASDGLPKGEILAIKFLNSEAAKKWKDKFEEAKGLIGKNCQTSVEERSEKEENSHSESDTSSSDDDSEQNEVNNSCEEEVSNSVAALKLNSEDPPKNKTTN